MDKIRKIIIILCILIIIIIAIIAFLKNKNKNTNMVYDMQDDGIGLTEEYIDYTVYPVNTPSVYYTVEWCVQKYLSCVSLNINEVDQTTNQVKFEALNEIKNNNDKYVAINDMLNINYKDKYNITLQNLKDYIKITNEPLKFTALKMNSLDVNNIRMYGVYGRIEEIKTGKLVSNSYFKVIFDIDNMSFCIEPIAYCDNINKISLQKEVSYIQKNSYNKYKYIKLTQKDLVSKYLDYFKTTAIKYPNEIYENLDEGYRKSKFSSEKEFEDYIESRKESIQNIMLSRYTKKEYTYYTEYTCVDTNGNYYIFRQTAIMKFDILLE